ncbi:serine/threonine-protein kinase DCLK1 [Drosophila ficusphila]|uniref:serine/threonine-protein kinase DCLK1 n=1 Tax=Drosophila ficusphila TaxID=30025 RepID=UPI0007E75EA8|nr:serine/threonine-protein kinase DCLK1 [Drosophila ficusphila]
MSDTTPLFRSKRLQPRPLKALRVCFLRNGDRHFKGVNMVVSHTRFKDFRALLQGVTEALRRLVVLRSAIANIRRIDGSLFTSLGCFSEGDIVICCCQYEDIVWVRYEVNKDFLRFMDSQNRWQERRMCGETLEKIVSEDLPLAIKLYISHLDPLVQNARTLIYRGRSRANRMKCIVKVVNKNYMDFVCQDSYIEAEVVRHLQSHPNIVELMYSVEEARYVYLVLEYLDSDLYQVIRETGALSEEDAKLVMRATVAGLMHMHQLQLIHRDIKPENILLRFSPDSEELETIKITDFGMATYYRGSKLYSCCGTPCYMAPELITESGYDYQVDSWSLGVTLFYILYGQLPFGDIYHIVVEIYAAIMSGERNYPQNAAVVLSTEARQLINGLLMKEPTIRLTIAEVAQHPFLA